MLGLPTMSAMSSPELRSGLQSGEVYRRYPWRICKRLRDFRRSHTQRLKTKLRESERIFEPDFPTPALAALSIERREVARSTRGSCNAAGSRDGIAWTYLVIRSNSFLLFGCLICPASVEHSRMIVNRTKDPLAWNWCPGSRVVLHAKTYG